MKELEKNRVESTAANDHGCPVAWWQKLMPWRYKHQRGVSGYDNANWISYYECPRCKAAGRPYKIITGASIYEI